MASFNVLVSVTRTFRIESMDAVDEADVQEQLYTLFSNNELDENMDVTAEDVTEDDADFNVIEILPAEE